MSTLEDPLAAGATCAKCGMGVHERPDGRVACDGCDSTTEECSCQPQQPI